MAQLKNTKIDSDLEVTRHIEVGNSDNKCIIESTGSGDVFKGAIGFPNSYYTIGNAFGQNIFGKNLWVTYISPYGTPADANNVPTIQISGKEDENTLTLGPETGTTFNISCTKLMANGCNIGRGTNSVFISSDLDRGTAKYPLYVEFKNFFISTDGNVHAYSYNARSDKRLKENLIPFTSEKSILDLPTYKFDFINGKKNQIGCMAQDLQEICPEIVDEGNDGYLSIQESKIVYLLLEEVKKLRKEIDELKRR